MRRIAHWINGSTVDGSGHVELPVFDPGTSAAGDARGAGSDQRSPVDLGFPKVR
jgi:hypothetical protein